MPASRRRVSAKKKSVRRTKESVDLDPVSARLELMIGMMLLPPDAKEAERIAIAERAGLDGAAVARIFKKTRVAADKALSRARQ